MIVNRRAKDYGQISYLVSHERIQQILNCVMASY
jgi:hypothetical protein